MHELRNTVERVIIMRARNEIDADDLPILGAESPPASSYNFDSYREAWRLMNANTYRKLAETDGNVSRAAEMMGIDRSHLYRRMKALGINRA